MARSPDEALTVYNGVTCLGSVVETEDGWGAFTEPGQPIGTFAKRGEAVSAVGQAARAGA